MPTVLEAIVGSTTYNLSDGTLAWREGEDGLGMAPTDRLTEKGPLQDGVSDVGFRLRPRNVQLILGVNGSTEADMYSKRSQLLEIFKPLTSTPIKVKYTLPGGEIRQLDCFYNGEMTFPSSDRRGFYQKVGVVLYAPDPVSYDPTQQSVTFSVSPGGFMVPLPVPFFVGASTISSSQTITLSGYAAWRDFPVIRLYGPITDPTVENLATDEQLRFTGTISSSDYWEIDCRYGYKTVTDSGGGNQISKLSADSDLATFHLAPAPEASGGVNTIQVGGSGITTASQIQVLYYRRYIGF